MIPATICRICNAIDLDDYCTENIQPLLLKSKGSPIYFGKYSEDGNTNYYISATYAKDRPSLASLGMPKAHPFAIAEYLKSLGYNVDWVLVKDPYPAGKSSSGRTHYYNAGYNTYYSLKIVA